MRFSLLCVVLLASLNVGSLEASERILELKGSIVQESAALPEGHTIAFRNLTNGRSPGEVQVMSDGSFELSDLDTGEYEVKISTLSGDLVHQEFINIGENVGPLLVRLPLREVTPQGGGTVSVRHLLHRPSSKAVREYRAALKSCRSGRVGKCQEHLERAIEIDADYMEAHNNLGVRYMAQDQYDKAVVEFQRTVELDPSSTRGQLNLSLALSLLKRYSEAEEAARRALQLEPRSIPARYALGQILAVQDKNTPEAVKSLQMATEQFPNARLPLARVLVCRGAIKEAVRVLREYLQSGTSEKRQEVQTWLAHLTSVPAQ
jgi:tetratricopeptide (TPR) repeat protein